MTINITTLISLAFFVFIAALTFSALFVVNKSDKELDKIFKNLGYYPRKKDDEHIED